MPSSPGCWKRATCSSKGFIRPDQIGNLRAEILDLYGQHGWTLPGTDPIEGRVDKAKSCAEGEPPYLELYQRLYSLRSFHAVAHAPESRRHHRQARRRRSARPPQQSRQNVLPAVGTAHHANPPGLRSLPGLVPAPSPVGRRCRTAPWSWADSPFTRGRGRRRFSATTSRSAPAC